LMQVTAHEIQQVAQDLFREDKINLAIVGPLKPADADRLVKLLKI
jgi:hypothetical protein